MKKIFFLLLFALAPILGSADVISIKNQGDITATTTAQQFLSANMTRKYLLVVNKGSRDAYLKFEVAPAGTEGILIPAGGNYESDRVPIGPAFIKTASTTTEIYYLEGE
jgi:hypothetical protein